jgi:hypothetical protein
VGKGAERRAHAKSTDGGARSWARFALPTLRLLKFSGAETMTPFELSLENDLHVEWQRFTNDWLFKWHGMTYEGGVTDVDDFLGGRIHYSGIKFGDQQQQIFWQAIDRYLLQTAHDIFKRWNAETATYPAAIRLTSIDGTERGLRQFVHRIIQHALDTDRRLRGMGYPENVKHFDSSGNISRAEVEITRLAHAHRALLDEKIKKERPQAARFLSRKWLEDFYANNKGLIWFGGLAVAIIEAARRYFFG